MINGWWVCCSLEPEGDADSSLLTGCCSALHFPIYNAVLPVQNASEQALSDCSSGLAYSFSSILMFCGSACDKGPLLSLLIMRFLQHDCKISIM